MATLVPSYLSSGGVDVPLNASHLRIGLEKSVEELEPLRYALEEMVNGESRGIAVETLSREGFHVQGLSALPISPDRRTGTPVEGLIGWRRLSGHWPDLDDSFELTNNFTARDLVVPRPVLMDLVSQLRGLRAEIEGGKREGRVDGTQIPPLPALSSELEEYEALRKISREDAWAYAEELYARRA